MTACAAMANAPPITDVAAFHCQQTVEKSLKAFLVFRGQPFEKTHDLVELMALCERHDVSFAELRASVEPLTPYAVRFRYPGPAEPTVEAVQSAIVIADQVWHFVNKRCPGTTGPIE